MMNKEESDGISVDNNEDRMNVCVHTYELYIINSLPTVMISMTLKFTEIMQLLQPDHKRIISSLCDITFH